jgi:hypothetical protein
MILSNPLKSSARNKLMTVLDDYRSGASLTIRDAEGHRAVLYIADRRGIKNSPSTFEMPPLPPEGIFDIRFGSNRNLELYEPGSYSEFPLQILSARYPLTVTWEWNRNDIPVFLRAGNAEWDLSASSQVQIENADAPVSLIVSLQGSVPNEYSLSQNYPNPFNPVTKIEYQLPREGWVSLKVFDMLGREVATLVDRNQRAGVHSAEFNADRLPSGIYLYKMTSGLFTDAKKMIIIK